MDSPPPDAGTGRAHRSIDEALRQLGAEVDSALRSGAMRCGPYTLLHVIGEGGFGIVYAASQDGDVRREVAVKILKPGTASTEILRRFALEQRALARIQHENVATILDAGMSDDGRPWFAMPLLDGESLVLGCDRAMLTLDERLAVFAQACDGVHAAHVHGIVHRDLKPANILLVPGPGGGHLPKVIDFGIAKAIDATEGITATNDRRRLGTPAFMAPEQLVDGYEGADARSDVYSLGMVLGELVSGTTIARRTASGSAPAAREELPSEAVDRVRRKDRSAADHAARDRGLDSGLLLQRRLHGDIDAIVAKATATDPRSRYASADALAADVRRALAHEPVLARKQGWAYVALRFVQRNRVAVAMAAVGLAAIVGLAATAAVAALRAGSIAREAAVDARRADQVSDFMRAMLDGIDADLLDGRDGSVVVDLLTASSARLRVGLGSTDPVVAARIADPIARALVGFEEPERALMLLREVDAHVGRALRDPSGQGNRPMLARELARLRMAEGVACWDLKAQAPGTGEDQQEALASWRAALDVLAESGQLDDPLAAGPALRIWYARESWPASRDFDDFEAWVAAVIDRLPDSDPVKWQFQIRRVEIDNWIGIMRNYPPLLEGFARAFGPDHPLVVRTRVRYLNFLLSAGVESQANWRTGIPRFDDAALRLHWERIVALAGPVIESAVRVYGKKHSITLSAQLWGLGAEGYLLGSAATEARFRALRAEILSSKGPESRLNQALEGTWKGVSQGIQHGIWWK
jgi:hypothetical protein